MSKKLLVVEDSKAIASVIEKIGQALGYQVTIAASLAEVEALFQQNHEYFVATIDYGLPDAPDGEAIALVLSHGVPGIVMTGRMDEITRKKILAQPVVDYIPKENSQAFMYLKRILFWQITNPGTGVLVVDDSRAARNHVVDLLKRRNFTVYEADNGHSALLLLAQHQNIKLVITDLEMPGMDGIELTNEIRKNYHRDQLAIIGLSGTSNGTHSARFIKNGADDFLRKPFCPEEFYCRMTQNIENLFNIAQIQKAANTDYLTELPNRRSFFDVAQKRLNDIFTTGESYGVAMLDIDYFKKINDTYGHDAGDSVLKTLANSLRKHFKNGLLARMGGEEFAMLLNGKNIDNIYQSLNDFRRMVSELVVEYQNDKIEFTVSIGVIFNHSSSLPEQLTLADQALYQAKSNGRNQVCVINT